MNNLMSKKVTLGTAECAQMAGNASAFGYQCNRAMSQASTSNLMGTTVRFEHSSNFVVDICEVVIYANPSTSHKSLYFTNIVRLIESIIVSILYFKNSLG